MGWIYQYALVDRTGRHDIAQLRALQDWFLKYELKAVPNVAEVARVGGMVRQYQIVLDPDRMRAYRMPQQKVVEAVRAANQETGGSVLELGEAEYMVRASAYLKTLDDFRMIPLGASVEGTPILLKDVARVQIGPELRRGISELDGEGEAVGGVIVMRSGKNALETIEAVKAKLETLKRGLPQGVEIVETYDRSQLILRSVKNLAEKLLEEFLVVALVCVLFLWHLRSAFVAIVCLPLGILAAFIVMHHQGINANIMSLGGIAIAIGAMVDAAVVMIENAHKKLEAWRREHGRAPQGEEHLRLIGDAAAEVGPALFFSLLIITLSFVPVFTLEAQEGRLFSPLAYTKTYAMAAAAGLSVTLVPVLMYYLVRGRIADEAKNPLNRVLIATYRPLLDGVLRFPKTTLLVAAVVLAVTVVPLQQLGSEFMPNMDEGDLLYMPTALPGLSAGKAAEILQQTDRVIKTFPEVQSVFGKIGRAETATDPAPLEMVETTVRLKPRAEWRPGMTTERLIAEMDAALKIPGMANLWIPPIRNRIDMLATGIKSPVGIKVSGPDLATIELLGTRIEATVRTLPGVVSALAERVTGGRYIDVKIDRMRAARYGLSAATVQEVVSLAIGGENITETVEGLQRFPVNLRYPRESRDSVEKAARAADHHGVRRDRAARRGRRDRGDGWPGAAQKRERAAVGLGLRGRARARPRRLRARGARRGRAAGRVAGGLFGGLVGPVRVPRARREAPRGGGARHARHHPGAALPHVPAHRFGAGDPGKPAVRAGGRDLAHLGPRPQRVGRVRGRVHRARRAGGRVRRGDAHLSGSRHRALAERRAAGRWALACLSDHGGRGAARAAQGDDGGGHPCRPRAAAAGDWHRLGSDATHRRADDRRHDIGAAAFDVHHSGGVPAAAPLHVTAKEGSMDERIFGVAGAPLALTPDPIKVGEARRSISVC